MAITHVFAGIPLADYDAARAWYERFFGRAPDRLPHDAECVWQLTETGLVYVVADAGRAGTGLLTLIVDDLDAQLARLAERGIEADALEQVGAAGRKATIADPEGNTIAIAEVA